MSLHLISEPDPWALGWATVAAIATAAAVIVALWVAIVQLRDLNQLRHREATDRKRQQALRVSAWAISESEFPDVPSSHVTGNPWYAAVHVHNGSDASISDVRVEVGHRKLDGKWEGLREYQRWSIVPPGQTVRTDFGGGVVRNYSVPPHNVLLCTLEFTDSNNVRWHRDAFNVLTPAEEIDASTPSS